MKNNKYLISILFMLISWTSFAGGFIIITPNRTVTPHTLPNRFPHHPHYTLEVKSLKVDVKIKDQYVFTTIDQVFYNPSNRNLEGYFLFPVPKGAIIKNFSMEINGKKMQAELLDAAKARKIYEDIVRKLKDPALLEYSNQSLFRVRIFPIEAGKEKRIHISYSEILEKDNNTVEYVFPLNTKKYTATPLKNTSFKIELNSESKIKTIYSPSHEMEINRKGENSAVIGFEANVLKPDRDLKLFVGYAKSKIGVSAISYKEKNEAGFFMLNISPGLIADKNKIISKDITFVLDVSGSMAGKKMDQAKKALSFCVANLNSLDKFQIIRFSTEAEALFNQKVVANTINKAKAQKFVTGLRPIGGTNIDEALKLAYNEKKSDGRPNMIVFITDGKPTIGETDEKRLVKQVVDANIGNTRIFTFGIGDNINIHLLDKITEETKAYRTYITPEEDIEIKVSNFYTKVSSPILSEVKLYFNGGVKVNKMFPKNLPDLFEGSSITVFGKFDYAGSSKIILEGKVNGKTEKFNYQTKFVENTNNDFIAPLWAARNVGYLLDQIRLNGESKEVIDEIVQLAKKYGIITPYTSYLILEDEEINITNRRLAPEQRIFTDRFDDEVEFKSRSKEEYSNLGKKSGRGGVVSSNEVQSLRGAKNLADQTQGLSRMVYMDKSKVKRDFSQQCKNIGGRAFYQNGNKWVDLYVQTNKSQIAKKIQFAGKPYFDLLNRYPEVSQYLSLGKNVRFVHNNKLYEIYE
ncbi:MAG: VIT and VWA domain-containing protein [Bacteroidota bacterium]